ncbi:hypothetical protein LTS18_012914 [Coniosporium uncinatum]|uniref:Uncharacterized protein n=1 Tax=Coniosporium uncinatum TaxID=93489 RepID=A0ACC3DIP1_9PEZI|nr:hypothetical protein LTS18_012914 [Coniosporium uncinatum]
MGAEVQEAERRVHQSRLLFEDMGRLMRGELERFEREKVEDFRMGVETFLESAVEAQKELIELWETFLMQLDADEEGAAFGSVAPPAGVQAAQPKAQAANEERPTTADSETTAGAPSMEQSTLVEEDDDQ